MSCSCEFLSQGHLIRLVGGEAHDVRVVWLIVQRKRTDIKRRYPAITGEDIDTPNERPLPFLCDMPPHSPSLALGRFAMAIHREFNPLVRNKELRFDRSIRPDMSSVYDEPCQQFRIIDWRHIRGIDHS